MLQVYITIVEPAQWCNRACLVAAVVANELGHRPRFQRRPMLPQARKTANQHTDQLALALPETRQEFPFFLRCQQVGRENGGWCKRYCLLLRRQALATSWLHGRFPLYSVRLL